MFSYKNSLVTILVLSMFVGCSTPKPKIAECAYMPKVAEGDSSSNFSPQGECGKFIDEDTLVLYSDHFNNLHFGESNLVSIYTNSGMFYISKSGKVMKTVFFDNGADYFKEGLVRTIVHGKYGFMNGKLEIVIEPQFDFVFPFSEGKARFCNSCREKKAKDDEHGMMVDGKWGFVDRGGKVIFD